MYKQNLIFLIIFVLLILLTSACGQKQANMNELASDGLYHYINQDLGFSLALPPDFIYYQTQRTAGSGYTDLEFFVPTRDTDYEQSIPGYGKPIVVRIFDNVSQWQKQEQQTTDTESFLKRVGEKGGKVYTLIFWQTIPSDWKQIWNDIFREKIVGNFKIL